MIGRYVFRKKLYFFLAFFLDTIGYPWSLIFGVRKKLSVRSPKNILIVRLDHLGDIFLSSAVPKILKQKYPDAKITFLSSSIGKTILANNPFIDDSPIYNTTWYLRKTDISEKNINHDELVSYLKKRRFDLALSLRGDLRENRLLWQAGIPYRIGYGITGGGFFLNHEIPYRFGAHEIEHTLDILRGLGLSADALKPRIYFSIEEERALSQKIADLGITLKDDWVELQIDAGSSSKCWPTEHIQSFLKRFVSDFPSTKIALVGGLRSWKAEGIPAPSILDLCGKTSQRELFFLIKNLKAFVGPDSGPAHVAASMDIPTLFLYSGTNIFEQWKSLSPNASFLRHQVPCAPCHLTDCVVTGHPCMAGIEPQAVLDWLKTKVIGGPA